MTSPASTPSDVQETLIHVALLYRDPEHLRRVVAEFAEAATHAGEPLLVLLPRHSLDLLDDVLDGAGGELRREDMAQAASNPSRLIQLLVDWIEAHATVGGRVRVISEPLWPGRLAAEVAECLRHEALLNLALAGEPISVLCPYDAERLEPEHLAGAELTHPQVIDVAGPRSSARYGDPLDIARGEHWPQPDPAGPVRELPFGGDLWALRRTLADEWLLAGLAPERREDLVFAVNEAASNAIRHGDGTCRTRLWRDGDRIVSEVSTPSAIVDPLAGRRRPDPGATSGRGLWLINQVCDLVELRNGPEGASLRMHVAAA